MAIYTESGSGGTNMMGQMEGYVAVDDPTRYSTTDQKSKADYSDKNVAWLIEFIAQLYGVEAERTVFVYPTGGTDTTPLQVRHPGDKEYLSLYKAEHSVKSADLKKYEYAAKASLRFKAYERKVGVTYFQS